IMTKKHLAKGEPSTYASGAAAKQSRKIKDLARLMDCFASLAMTPTGLVLTFPKEGLNKSQKSQNHRAVREAGRSFMRDSRYLYWTRRHVAALNQTFLNRKEGLEVLFN
ncbi:MAG: hypothetical protein QM537_05420, partial [Candidatus Symbiobacter sp.]|nr:hypothetical protein [Candidatus Symbiobacter sp.]